MMVTPGRAARPQEHTNFLETCFSLLELAASPGFSTDESMARKKRVEEALNRLAAAEQRAWPASSWRP